MIINSYNIILIQLWEGGVHKLNSELCLIASICDVLRICSYSLGLCAELIQIFLEKAVSLKMNSIILTTILVTFIYPSVKQSQRQSISCCGIYDFSYSAGLLLYAIFLILKMVYPAMNFVYWLIPAGTVAITYVSL